MASSDRYGFLKEHARNNRSLSTDAEYILWQHLRKSQLGVRFRRQQAISDYIVDFYCVSEQMIIEVDGGYHEGEMQTVLDFHRQKELEELGYRVIRFTNEQVLFHIEDVILEIRKNIVFTNNIVP